MHSIDLFVQNYFSLVRSASLTEFNFLVTSIFDFSLYFIAVVLCTMVLIYLVRDFRYAVLFGGALFISAVIVYFLKSFFDISRPADSIALYFGQSFPSYHATIATVFFVMLMYIFDDYLKSFGRIVFNSFCILFIFLTAISRVYLGAHWVSDVFFGIILGALISYLAILIFRKSYRM